MKSYLIIAGIAFSAQALSETKFESMCNFPELSEEIKALEPKMDDFVVTSPTDDMDLFQEQYEKYSTAEKLYKEQFKDEIEEVQRKQEELDSKLNASQRRFYKTYPKNWEKDEELLANIKSSCWAKVMGADEYEADQFCNPLKNEPSSHDWNDILTCTLERSHLMGIRLYR